MGIEIERKFLVAHDAWWLEADRGQLIRQGYLARGPARSVRVRRAGERGYLTVKGSDGAVRSEFEYEIPVEDANELLDSLCEPGLIEKTRYQVWFGGRLWEVDVFHGRHTGLVLAEVELPTIDAPVELPEWVGVEVTGDSSYTNAQLSRISEP